MPNEDVVRRILDIIGRGRVSLARSLAREGVRTRSDLKKPEIFDRLPREARAKVRYGPVRVTPLSVARKIVAELQRRVVFDFAKEGIPRLRCGVIPVGSVRRQAPHIRDTDLLIVVPTKYERFSEDMLDAVALRPARPGDRVRIVEAYASGARRKSLVLQVPRGKYYCADLFLTTAGQKPFALFHYTGSKSYNIRTRAHAKRKGWLLNQYGLYEAASGRKVRGTSSIRTERDLARFLGVTYRPPTDRNE